jgi:hypothetical protein
VFLNIKTKSSPDMAVFDGGLSKYVSYSTGILTLPVGIQAKTPFLEYQKQVNSHIMAA